MAAEKVSWLKKIAATGGVLGVLGSAWSAHDYFDGRYAMQTAHAELKLEVSLNRTEDQYYRALHEYLQCKKLLREHANDVQLREQCERQKRDVDDLRELKNSLKKTHIKFPS